jgi:hypothetical protein
MIFENLYEPLIERLARQKLIKHVSTSDVSVAATDLLGISGAFRRFV